MSALDVAVKGNPTWSEMITYLEKQPNQKIHYNEIKVNDLHRFVEHMKYLVELHPPEERIKNVNCLSLKGSVRKVYDAVKYNELINF